MATLASIPEASSFLSQQPDNLPHRHQRAASLKRPRPRPRILLPRRPNRARNSDQKLPKKASRLQNTSHSNTDNFIQPHKEDQFSPVFNPMHNLPMRPRTSRSHSSYSQFQSPFGSSSCENGSQPSEPSVDLDSFPLPPFNNSVLHQDRCLNRLTNTSTRHYTKFQSQSGLSAPVQKREPNAHYQNLCQSPASRGWFVDGAADFASASKRTSIDSALVEAISKSICQQLRLFSHTRSDRSAKSPPGSQKHHVGCVHHESSTPSQEASVDRFTRNLRRYAERTGTQGKKANSPLTPSKSGATLHTVSALLPFRPEFTAAGLAVTSKEQMYGVPSYITQAVASGSGQVRYQPPEVIHKAHVAQLDGHGPQVSSNTEISFAPSKDMDEWRYALIDEVPTRKKKQSPNGKKNKPCCLPCFPGDEEPTTDGDWAHFRAAAGNGAFEKQNSGYEKVSRIPPPRPARPDPLVSQVRNRSAKEHQPNVESIPQSPRQRRAVLHQHREENTDQSKIAFNSNSKSQEKVTGLRRPSMTLPLRNYNMPLWSGDHSISNAEGVALEPEACPNTRTTRMGISHHQPVSQQKTSEKRILFPKLHQDLQASSNATRKLTRDEKLTTHPKNNANRLPDRPSVGKLPFASRAQLDTTKKPSRSLFQAEKDAQKTNRKQSQTAPYYDPNHIRICCRNSRGIPSRAAAPPNIPRRTSSIQGSLSSVEIDYDDREITDREVLRGLHIAASAACDEEVDAFVQGKTGLRIRRFLADLMMLETLRELKASEESGNHARRRRAEMRKLKQQVRRSREIRKTGLAS